MPLLRPFRLHCNEERQERCAYLGEEDGVDVRAVLEAREHLGAFRVGRRAVDERLVQAHGVLSQGKDVVAEHDYLVAPHLLVVADQELAGLELLGVEDRERDAPVRSLLQGQPVRFSSSFKISLHPNRT